MIQASIKPVCIFCCYPDKLVCQSFRILTLTVLNFSKFYETKEDFNNIYGLSLEYIDLVVLTNKVVTNAEWLSVYKVTRVKGKVKEKHVRLELYKDCMMLHQKVHQEIPINELSVAITRVFTTRIVHMQRK